MCVYESAHSTTSALRLRSLRYPGQTKIQDQPQLLLAELSPAETQVVRVMGTGSTLKVEQAAHYLQLDCTVTHRRDHIRFEPENLALFQDKIPAQQLSMATAEYIMIAVIREPSGADYTGNHLHEPLTSYARS